MAKVIGYVARIDNGDGGGTKIWICMRGLICPNVSKFRGANVLITVSLVTSTCKFAERGTDVRKQSVMSLCPLSFIYSKIIVSKLCANLE